MKEKRFTLIGVSFISIAIVCNQWILASLFSPDGVLEFESKAAIWLFELVLMLLGFIILKYKKTLDAKKLAFSILAIVIFLISTELGLAGLKILCS